MKKTIIDYVQLSDEELLSLIGENRKQVLSHIYNRYEKLIFFKAKSIVKDHHQAMDLTHDIFVKIFTNLHQFKGKSKFSLWVHSISFNTSLKYLKKNSRFKIFDIKDQHEEVVDSAYEDINEKRLLEIDLDNLEKSIEALKPDEKYLLFMKYTDGLTIREISAITGLKESNIKMKLKRSRDKLMNILN